MNPNTFFAYRCSLNLTTQLLKTLLFSDRLQYRDQLTYTHRHRSLKYIKGLGVSQRSGPKLGVFGLGCFIYIIIAIIAACATIILLVNIFIYILFFPTTNKYPLLISNFST